MSSSDLMGNVDGFDRHRPAAVAAWAATFAVAMAFAGISGMTFEFMPELTLNRDHSAALGLAFPSCTFRSWRVRRSGLL